MHHLYLSATHKSSGKTTVTLGLARALSRRGRQVQTFKKGPDYIDPIWHSKASGRPCYNLDFNMMPPGEIEALFACHVANADITLIEGNMGLYDGMDLEGSNSNAALAKLLGAPVVLIVDVEGMTRGVAPLLLGYQAFDPKVHFAGIILNKIAGKRHEEKLRAVIERYTDLPVLGAIHRDDRLSIPERHLGLIPSNEAEAADHQIDTIAEIVSTQVDLDALLALTEQVPGHKQQHLTPPSAQDGKGLRIGLARDRAFGFYYNEDLDTLSASGAELVSVDTLSDSRLPALDGLILGGGFPEMFIDELAANSGLQRQIRDAIEAGLPVHAECGGLMYLSRGIRWGERQGAMVGIVPGEAVMGDRPVGRGYATLAPTVAGKGLAAENVIHAHEFHHSHLENLPDGLSYAYDVLRGHGIDGRHDGFIHKNLIAAYCHRRGSGANGWIGPFLNTVRQHAELRNAALIAA
jgi:cobyrinic acid a,c-diamide synthase